MEDKYNGSVRVSSEKKFVYQDSYNRGHVQLPRMVINCLKLSSNAKIAYGVISGHVFEHGKSAFPSIARIAMACNCSMKSAINYVNELVDKGFVEKERRGNRRTNDYFLVDMDKVSHLHVSEMFWRAVNEAYRSVDSCKYDQVYDALHELLDEFDKQGIDFHSIPVTEEKERELISYLINKLNKGGEEVFTPPNKNKKPPVTQAPAEKQGRSLGKELGGTHRHDLADNVEKWSNDKFVQYFYERYIDATGNTHVSARSKHRGIIGRYLKHTEGNKAKVKAYIDAFFQIGYDTPTLEWFGTSGRIGELDTFISTGKKPFYLTAKEKQAKVEQAEQINKGMSAEAFLKRIQQFE